MLCLISIRFCGADMTKGSIDKLYHNMTSYKTRHLTYGDAVGCMEGTCVKILADLEDWALDNNSKKYIGW